MKTTCNEHLHAMVKMVGKLEMVFLCVYIFVRQKSIFLIFLFDGRTRTKDEAAWNIRVELQNELILQKSCVCIVCTRARH